MEFHVIADEDTVTGFRFAGVADGIRDRINAIRFGEALPLIVEIPGPEGPSAEGPSLLKLIREAVGIKL